MARPADAPCHIHEYGFISDCHSAALISKYGSIDWCCMPRMDSSSCFGRLLDYAIGGYCQIAPLGRFKTSVRYLENTMILETTFQQGKDKARILDFFAMKKGGRNKPYRQIIRIIEGITGEMKLQLDMVPRFEYGNIKPWIKPYTKNSFIAMGGCHGLLFSSNFPMVLKDPHHLFQTLSVKPRSKFLLSIHHGDPVVLDEALIKAPSISELHTRFKQTLHWWHRWYSQMNLRTKNPLVGRSALVLKALSNSRTGAIAAAATASLPESLGGVRNWDYRYSWIRDSYFSVRSLVSLGFVKEADGFRRFIERSSHSSADGLQTLFGLRGETRIPEYILNDLSGYMGSQPVRIGNAAEKQLQLDMFGSLIDLAWVWHTLGLSPDPDYWSFLIGIIDQVCYLWRRKDKGIWEMRTPARHFVHSKVMCWVALDRGIRFAQELNHADKLQQWIRTRQAIRQAIETKGYDKKRGVFVQAFNNNQMDASLLLLPAFGFIDYQDPRMIRTTDAIMKELDDGGLIRRYAARSDGLPGDEGAFLACNFWLVAVLAKQGRKALAKAYYKRSLATANPLGLFAEEYDAKAKRMLGNFPQALTHLSLIFAELSLQDKK